MQALIFALFCLVFTSLNDFIFKLFGRKQGAMGGFITLVGIIGVVAACIQSRTLPVYGTTMQWGIVVGFCSVAANILLLASMTVLPVGISSTLYRLNMIPVIFAGWILFGESLSWLHWGGIAAAIVAICCFFPAAKPGDKMTASMRVGFVLALGAMLTRAIMGILMKVGINHGASEVGMVPWISVMWIVGGIFYYFCRERRPETTFCNRHVLLYGILNGITVFLILFCTVKMLAAGNLSVTLPLAQMSFILTFLLGAFFLKEKIDLRRAIGAACGAIAVLLLAFCSGK